MPIYEYRCEACGHTIERLQKFSDAPLVECPDCHQPRLRKLVSAVGFQLKGSGWYVTDFRNIGTKPAAKPHDAVHGGPDGKANDGAGAGAGANGNGSGAGSDQPSASGAKERASPGAHGDTGAADTSTSGSKHAGGSDSAGSGSSGSSSGSPD